MIFRPRQMMHTEAMPKHYIGILDCPVLSRPCRQTIIPGRLVYELARRIPLILIKGRHP